MLMMVYLIVEVLIGELKSMLQLERQKPFYDQRGKHSSAEQSG